MNGLAMDYEYLIRRAYNCGRYGTTGADADIYRSLEHAFISYRDRDKGYSTKNAEELYGDYMRECGEVAAFVRMAIDHVIKTQGNRINKVQAEELESAKSLLFEPDINKIEESITRSEKAMLDLGLYPG